MDFEGDGEVDFDFRSASIGFGLQAALARLGRAEDAVAVMDWSRRTFGLDPAPLVNYATDPVYDPIRDSPAYREFLLLSEVTDVRGGIA